MAEQKFLDLVGLSTYDGKIKGKILAEDAKTLQEAKAYADGLAVNYDAVGTAQGLVSALESGQVATNKNDISTLKTNVGTIDNLETSAKTDLVSAINEVFGAIEDSETAGAVTIDTSSTTSGALKSYTIKQGGTTVGTIDIPKDMVVESGTVEVNPADQPEGTYIKLVLANVEEPLYINVGKLVDIYTAKQGATKVQVTIDSETREISATLVANSVTSTELADNAVVTTKIADANVTKTKLSTEVQNSLGKADTSLQSADITEGSANGAISVKGLDVKVKGLGSSAYTDTTAFDSAGTASSLVSALESGQVATNKTDITSLKGRVDKLEEATYVAISEEEISALFA